MSKQITIPTGRGNPVFVVLNGVRYTYTAGDTVTVPDDVAALFENNEGENVIYGRRAAHPLAAPVRKGSDEGVPVATDDDGNLYVPAEEIAGAALEAIYVEGHKLVIPEPEG